MNTTPDKKMTPMEELIEQLKKLSPESPMGNDVSKAFHGGIQLAIIKAKFLLEAEREYASQQAPASTPPVSANDMTAEEFFNHPDGMFTLNFLSEEEKQTLYKAIDLFVLGKLRQAKLSAPVSAMEDGWVKVEVLHVLGELIKEHERNKINSGMWDEAKEIYQKNRKL